MKQTRSAFRIALLNFMLLIISSSYSGTILFGQTFGITGQEISKIEDTGHQIQLWQVLPEYTKNAKYEISVKHAVAGSQGSFYITAWADTNNDGKPDKEIGRSELLTAKNQGDWSSWQFNSNYSKIFVGNSWSQSDEKIYYQIGGTIDGYVGLGNTVYFSRTHNGIPSQSTQPRYTNIKVKTINSGDVIGITNQEISKIEDAGHQIQLWQVLPEYTKNAKYEISMKHAVAGNQGSFYITAWADTNNDGKPDKEIGRSELLTAKNQGDWSSWQFTSNYSRIFVGNTWNQSDEKIYYQIGGTINGYVGLGNTVYFSRTFNEIPSQTTQPRYTNIKVTIR